MRTIHPHVAPVSPAAGSEDGGQPIDQLEANVQAMLAAVRTVQLPAQNLYGAELSGLQASQWDALKAARADMANLVELMPTTSPAQKAIIAQRISRLAVSAAHTWAKALQGATPESRRDYEPFSKSVTHLAGLLETIRPENLSFEEKRAIVSDLNNLDAAVRYQTAEPPVGTWFFTVLFFPLVALYFAALGAVDLVNHLRNKPTHHASEALSSLAYKLGFDRHRHVDPLLKQISTLIQREQRRLDVAPDQLDLASAQYTRATKDGVAQQGAFDLPKAQGVLLRGGTKPV